MHLEFEGHPKSVRTQSQNRNLNASPTVTQYELPLLCSSAAYTPANTIHSSKMGPTTRSAVIVGCATTMVLGCGVERSVFSVLTQDKAVNSCGISAAPADYELYEL